MLTLSQARQSRSAKVSAIHRIQTFLLSLANSEKDGRVLVSTSENGLLSLKYQLLNPSESFSDFAAARSVILAGGTMAPLTDFAQQVFCYLSSSRIRNLSCSHIVSQDNIFARAVGMGPSGIKLEFKYEQRNDPKILDEYGSILLNVTNIVSKGVVVFLPSYASLSSFAQRWNETGVMASMMMKKAVRRAQPFFSQSKEFYTNSRNRSFGSLQMALKQMACCETLRLLIATNPLVYTHFFMWQTWLTSSKHGALLLAVVGAKLSEVRGRRNVPDT